MEKNNPALNHLSTIRYLLGSISKWILVLFTALAPLKFGLPYTYNIEQAVPRDFISLIFETWPAEWGILALLIAFILYIFSLERSSRSARLKIGWIELGVGIFLLGIAVNIIAHGAKTGGIQTLLLFSSYGLYFFLLRVQFPTFIEKKRLFAWGVGSFVLIVLYGFYQYFEGLDKTLAYVKETGVSEILNGRIEGRISGKKIFSTFIYSNSLGGYLIMWCPLVIGALLIRRLRRTAFQSALLALIVFLFLLLFVLQHRDYIFHYVSTFLTLPLSSLWLIQLTQSKGAILAMGLSVLLLPLFFAPRFGGRQTAFILCLLVGVILALAGAHLWKRLPGSFRVRQDYNRSSLNLISEKPIVGHGMGTYGVHYMRVKKEKAEEVQLAHFDFLQLWVEGGLLCIVGGLFIFIGPFFNLWKHLKKGELWGTLLCVAWLAGFFHRMVDFDLYVPALGFPTITILHFIPEGCPRFRMNISARQWLAFRLASGGLSILGIILLIKLSSCLLAMEEGRYYKETKQLKKAISAYQDAMDHFAYLPAIHVRLAEILMITGHVDNAETAWENALTISPENAVTWFRYAMYLSARESITGQDRMNEIMNALNNAVYYYPTNENFRQFRQRYRQYRGIQ